ncbi:MAG TPA: hypothetical protein VLE27_16465 [Thermoanaerobaculia bacterium]|nr:hypothetical protein [Thermoanaerobaculia bacterium]
MLPIEIRRPHSLLLPILLLILAGCRAAAPGDPSASDQNSANRSATTAASDCPVQQVRNADAQSQAAVGDSYKACFERTNNRQYAVQAVDAYAQAAQLGLERQGRIQSTREIADLLVQLQDKNRLQEVFGRLLDAATARDQDSAYLVLVDYADALAKLGDESAWKHFERAIEIHPQNNTEAINRYARHLIDRGKPEQAVEMLERSLTKQERIRFVKPAYLRQEALQRAGRDTASADEEIAHIESRRGGRSREGAARDPSGT